MNVRLLANIFHRGAFLLLVCACLLAQDSSRVGVIRGVVLDSTSQPVSEATVRANFAGGFDGLIPSAQTDESGHFVIEHLAWGRWYVTALKEQDGYPDEANAFYGGLSPTAATVDLKTNAPERTITVHLGRKAGNITGTISDAETGKPIEKPCAQLQWKSVPFIYWRGYGLLESKFRLLVPADTDFTLMVWAWGYDPWVYKSDDGSEALRVHASDQLKLHVRLTPNSDKAQQPAEEELKKIRESVSAGGCDVLPAR